MSAELPALRAEGLAGGGGAVAHHGGETWFIAGALPGELVVAKMQRRRAQVVQASAVELVADPHPARTSPPGAGACCDGCDWWFVDPVAAAPLKARVAAGAARGLPHLAHLLAGAAVQPSRLHWRLRARLHWEPRERVLGFFTSGSWRPQPVHGCRALSPRLAGAVGSLEAALTARCPAPVDVDWLEDLEGQTAVAALRPGPRTRGAVSPRWLPAAEDAIGVVAGFSALDRGGHRQGGWGADRVLMTLPRPLEVPVGAFFQGNRHLVRWLFARIAELLAGDADPVWDLHAGVGFLAAAASTGAARPLTLVEASPVATAAAARNLPEARVCTETTAAWLARHPDLPRAGTALLDPPRQGLGAAEREAIARWRPRRLVMLGCDPATWARDADALLGAGYTITHLELVDLFPGTHHVEVLAVLETG